MLGIVAPDFGYTKSGVDRKFGERFIRRVDFDDDVRRRVFAEIDFTLSNNALRIRDVVAGVRLCSLGVSLSLPGRRAARFNVQVQLVAQSIDDSLDETLVFFVLRKWTHNLQLSLIVSDPNSGTICEFFQKLFVVFPMDVSRHKSDAFRQMIHRFPITHDAGAHIGIIRQFGGMLVFFVGPLSTPAPAIRFAHRKST